MSSQNNLVQETITDLSAVSPRDLMDTNEIVTHVPTELPKILGREDVLRVKLAGIIELEYFPDGCHLKDRLEIKSKVIATLDKFFLPLMENGIAVMHVEKVSVSYAVASHHRFMARNLGFIKTRLGDFDFDFGMGPTKDIMIFKLIGKDVTLLELDSIASNDLEKWLAQFQVVVNEQ